MQQRNNNTNFIVFGQNQGTHKACIQVHHRCKSSCFLAWKLGIKQIYQEQLSTVSAWQNIGLGFWCLTPLSTIFQLYRGSQKTTDLPQVTDELDHIMLYRVLLAWTGFQTDNVNGDRHCIHLRRQKPFIVKHGRNNWTQGNIYHSYESVPGTLQCLKID